MLNATCLSPAFRSDRRTTVCRTRNAILSSARYEYPRSHVAGFTTNGMRVILPNHSMANPPGLSTLCTSEISFPKRASVSNCVSPVIEKTKSIESESTGSLSDFRTSKSTLSGLPATRNRASIISGESIPFTWPKNVEAERSQRPDPQPNSNANPLPGSGKYLLTVGVINLREKSHRSFFSDSDNLCLLNAVPTVNWNRHA